MDYEKAFNKSIRVNGVIFKALRACQIALCPEFETCGDRLKDGESCACGFEDGPCGTDIPKNRAALADIKPGD